MIYIYIYTSPGQAVACKYGRREVDSSFGLQDCKARNHMRTKRKTCVLFGPQFERITSALVICILSLPAFLGHIWWTHHCSLLNITVFFACTPDQTFLAVPSFYCLFPRWGWQKNPIAVDYWIGGYAFPTLLPRSSLNLIVCGPAVSATVLMFQNFSDND